jgi:hypothetical protein
MTNEYSSVKSFQLKGLTGNRLNITIAVMPESESTEARSKREDSQPITRQVNEWFGRQHRAWYFFFGFSIAAASSWYIFVPTVLDQVRVSYNSIFTSQDRATTDLQSRIRDLYVDAERLRDSIDYLRKSGKENVDQLRTLLRDSTDYLIKTYLDSIQQLSRLGFYWGEFEVPILMHWSSGDGTYLYGRTINAVGHSYASLSTGDFSLTIDTCRGVPDEYRFDSTRQECFPFVESLPYIVDIPSPLKIGDNTFYFLVKKVTPKSITVDLYMRD